jgi:hypothetical protein
MRVSPRQIQTLKSYVTRHFGPNAGLWLFGSRINDALRGGDFDFYLETDLAGPTEIVERRLLLLADLHASADFGGEKIDLVIRPVCNGQTAQELPIYRVARRDGIPL